MGIKVCTQCYQEKPLECFHLRNSAKDKKSSECKECHRKRKAIYYLTHRELCLATSARNQSRYKERRYLWWRLRYQSMRALPVITKNMWASVLRRYKNRCVWCGKDDVDLTIDHLIPIFRGGDNSFGNIVPACRSCNSKKGIKSVVGW